MLTVFVIPDLSIGGLQWHLIRLANYIEKNSTFVVHVVIMSDDASLVGELNHGVQIHRIRGKFSHPLAIIRLIRTIRKLKPSVLIGWSLYPSIFIGLFFKLFSNAKLIAFEANYPPLAYNFGGKSLNLGWLYSMAVRNVDLVTANSQRTTEYLAALLPTVSVRRCFNPVRLALKEGSCRDAIWPRGGHRFLAVGRILNKHKGFDIIVEAARALALECTEEWSVVIVGDGPDYGVLLDMIDDFGLQSRISLVGRRHDVSAWMSSCDTFLLSSRFEGFPNVLIEAMQSSAFVIATDCSTGPSEIVEDGVTGLLVPVDDVDAFRNAMLTAMLTSQSVRARIAESGRTSTAPFSVDEAGRHFLTQIVRA